MAFVATDATDSSRMRRPLSLGPIKMQFLTWAAVSGDTTGTITVDGMVEVTGVIIDGLQQSAAATFSGNVVTLAFRDPSTTGALFGDIIVFGV